MAVTVNKNGLLAGKVAVVTGASRGIGEAIALRYAQEGAKVVVSARTVDEGDHILPGSINGVVKRIRDAGGEAIAVKCDLSSREERENLIKESEAAFGAVDILVNNAGGGFWSPFLDVNAKGELALVRENFGSVTIFTRHTVPLMTNGGSIINVTSIEGHRAGPGFAVYSAMKAAVANLTKSLALELGARMIRVNCLAPDVIPTPGTGAIAVKTPLPRMTASMFTLKRALGMSRGQPSARRKRPMKTCSLKKTPSDAPTACPPERQSRPKTRATPLEAGRQGSDDRATSAQAHCFYARPAQSDRAGL